MGTKKLNEALGIESIDGLLKDLDIETEVKDLSQMEDQMRENVEEIDSQIQCYNETGLKGINVSELNSSLNEIKDLISIAKDTIRKVYESIADQELVDSEQVQALGNLIEASHLSIKEYVDIFKDRVAFYDRVRLEAIKHQYKLEEMKQKHEYDLEKLDKTAKPKEVDINTSQDTVAFEQEKVIGDIV